MPRKQIYSRKKKVKNKSLPPKNMRSTEIKYLQKDMVLLEGKDALKNTEETLASKERVGTDM